MATFPQNDGNFSSAHHQIEEKMASFPLVREETI